MANRLMDSLWVLNFFYSTTELCGDIEEDEKQEKKTKKRSPKRNK